MQTSEKGLKFIKGFEGFAANAYLDGGGVPTIAYGHTANVQLGQTVTADQANAFLAEDLKHAEAAIDCQITVPLNQNEFDALVSLVYNIGAGNFFDSHLKKYLNLGDRQTAANWFAPWCRIHGVESDGLLRRRQAEAHLFLTPPDGPSQA